MSNTTIILLMDLLVSHTFIWLNNWQRKWDMVRRTMVLCALNKWYDDVFAPPIYHEGFAPSLGDSTTRFLPNEANSSEGKIRPGFRPKVSYNHTGMDATRLTECWLWIWLSTCLQSTLLQARMRKGKDFRFYLIYTSSIGFSCEPEPVLVRLDKWQKKDVLNMYLVKDFRITLMKLADMKDAHNEEVWASWTG